MAHDGGAGDGSGAGGSHDDNGSRIMAAENEKWWRKEKHGAISADYNNGGLGSGFQSAAAGMRDGAAAYHQSYIIGIMKNEKSSSPSATTAASWRQSLWRRGVTIWRRRKISQWRRGENKSAAAAASIINNHRQMKKALVAYNISYKSFSASSIMAYNA